jgi:hypothetical protein
MKHFVYLLILVNVVVFLWESGFRESGNSDSGSVSQELAIPDNAERIILTREAAQSIVAESPEPAQTEIQPIVLATEPVPASASEQESEPASIPTPAGIPVPAAKPPVLAGDCFRIGPAPTKARAGELLDLIKTHAGEASVETKPGEVPSGFWILYPKAASMDAARENRQMLLGKHVTDMWVFDRGPLRGAISLGLYGSRDQAEVAQKQFTNKGIVTEIVPRMVRGRVFWVRIPWRRPVLELEEIVQLLNTQDPDSRIPSLVPCE